MEGPCIYIFTSPSGTSYIGKTVDFKGRLRQHRAQAKKKTNRPFYNAINKYGLENFSIQTIPCPEEDAFLFERLMIAVFKGIGEVYNLTDGGEGMSGYSHTPEACERIGASHRGKKRPPRSQEWIEKIRESRIGYKATPETRAKQSAAAKGKPKTPEHNAKVSAARKGIVFSPETIEKMRLAKTGVKDSEETKAKKSASSKVSMSNPITVEKIRASVTAAKSTPEARLSASIKSKEAWARRKAEAAAQEKAA